MSETKGEKLMNYWLKTSVELGNHGNVNFRSVFFLVLWPGPTHIKSEQVITTYHLNFLKFS